MTGDTRRRTTGRLKNISNIKSTDDEKDVNSSKIFLDKMRKENKVQYNTYDKGTVFYPGKG